MNILMGCLCGIFLGGIVLAFPVEVFIETKIRSGGWLWRLLIALTCKVVPAAVIWFAAHWSGGGWGFWLPFTILSIRAFPGVCRRWTHLTAKTILAYDRIGMGMNHKTASELAELDISLGGPMFALEEHQRRKLRPTPEERRAQLEEKIEEMRRKIEVPAKRKVQARKK